MKVSLSILDYYAEPAAITAAGPYADALAALPDDLGSLVNIVQGVAIHEFVTQPFYGVKVPQARAGETHIRHAREMFKAILGLDQHALDRGRPPDKRLVGVCHHFAVLLLALLRAKGIPARARWGFGAYFNPGYFEDHVLCEVWRADQKRWTLVDPQFDAVWVRNLRIGHDILDVPRDQFLIAGDAWELCRMGKVDPEKFGIAQGNLRGLWFAASSLIRDVACLHKVEMLPWDVWGAMPAQGKPIGDEQLAWFDRLAVLTRRPDASFDELQKLYEEDPRLTVPAQVFNARMNRLEAV